MKRNAILLIGIDRERRWTNAESDLAVSVDSSK